ncbi:transcriptional regulator [Lentzea sp. NBRC 105346]|uniref:winged helix-turn-helix transcriptional regulator n=1 Tax=Lentzea sp. NBRC 105346 TaxID=3032205 RepID=UPI0024A053CD|nr:helix-turn-helix domain-containing protein [Lentzea sp. NBRC 105346]GLZ29422.1 transcriptional regulator [Lentzea sp. NBRC 105346]
METNQLSRVDAYLRHCASRTVLETVANKWAVLLVGTLSHGTLRFGELRRRLDGITQKSLTQSLRVLERDGMVVRTVYPTIPPRVEYSLSPLGHSVADLMAGIRSWSEQHLLEILAAREAYDSRPAPAPVS